LGSSAGVAEQGDLCAYRSAAAFVDDEQRARDRRYEFHRHGLVAGDLLSVA